MEIIDLPARYEPLYFVCLEDWSDEMKEAGDHKARWYEQMKSRGLRVKLALDDRGEVGGMIQYVPIEQSNASGNDLYFINCIWVHGHKQGRGDFRKQGMGIGLLKAAEDDAKTMGAKGICAWGIPLPFWMKASWFKKHGYAVADKQAGFLGPVLLWKSFADNAATPKWVKQSQQAETTPGKVMVSAFLSGWCPAQNIVFERAKRACMEFGNKVEFRGFDTSDRKVFAEWGIADALFVDNKLVNTGPPPSYEKIRNTIAKRVKRL